MNKKKRQNYVQMVSKYHIDEKNKVVICEMLCYLQIKRATTISEDLIHNAMAKKLPYIFSADIDGMTFTGLYKTKGIARCNVGDTFSEETGKRIAESRAKAKAYRIASKAWKIAFWYVINQGQVLNELVKNSEALYNAETAHVEELVK